MKPFLCLWTSLLFFHGFLSMAQEAKTPTVAVPSAEDQVSPISETRDYPSRLLQAIEDEDVSLFLANVTDSKQINLADEDGMTPLMLAVEENLPWYVEKILEQKPNLNLKNELKDDALLLAMYSQNASVLKMLLDAGAQCLGLVNGEQQSPWMIAARNNAYHLVPLLKSYCAADIDLQHPRTGKTALILAAQKGAIRTYDQLLKVPANPKLKDHSGKRALDYMVKWTKPRKKNR
jgi:ankyrin repeat protein